MSKTITFIDAEIGTKDYLVRDIGALNDDGTSFHSASLPGFADFIRKSVFICGHNVINHDIKYLEKAIGRKLEKIPIDTLYLSPLLFPKRPYHKLLKDDKLQVDELNNPLNDCQKCSTLFYDEVNAFMRLSADVQWIFASLLSPFEEFDGFFQYLDFRIPQETVPRGFDLRTIFRGAQKEAQKKTAERIRQCFDGRVCTNAPVEMLVEKYPRELAYALALIGAGDAHSVTPPWLLKNFPQVDLVLWTLCNVPCGDGCAYCRARLDPHQNLQHFFGFSDFRTYDGEPLQEKAVRAAIDGRSLLAIFPTGGGKSLTFQLPALMAGASAHALTVVISPLQSLMKDQVDHLAEAGIAEAVTINGLLDPVSRADAIARVTDGSASLLYIAPEMLRSKTVMRMLSVRTIARFVIDEAHCFSAWGQDFRVDYLFVGDFIRQLQESKHNGQVIPVSCFTATAKQKVISDIRDYFKVKLDLNLDVIASDAARENLRYSVLHVANNEQKYNKLRGLLMSSNCPCIVYVSRTKRAEEIATKLTHDGFSAMPYHGKMDPNDKIEIQNGFIDNKIQVIVATSAFGMGVDKKDVGLVVHYDISDSLENYVQEAGRAGRDPNMQADCYVLFNDSDLDQHFVLLNQTKLSVSEIRQVWKAVKDLMRKRSKVCCSALEIARQAGWEGVIADVETRVRSALTALEEAGLIRRGNNVPQVYASSIMVQNVPQAIEKLEHSALFSEQERVNAVRIIKSLISARSIEKAQGGDAESRIDYLADTLGIEKKSGDRCCTTNATGKNIGGFAGYVCLYFKG